MYCIVIKCYTILCGEARFVLLRSFRNQGTGTLDLCLQIRLQVHGPCELQRAEMLVCRYAM